MPQAGALAGPRRSWAGGGCYRKRPRPIRRVRHNSEQKLLEKVRQLLVDEIAAATDDPPEAIDARFERAVAALVAH